MQTGLVRPWDTRTADFEGVGNACPILATAGSHSCMICMSQLR
jgi:hypothetical protein